MLKIVFIYLITIAARLSQVTQSSEYSFLEKGWIVGDKPGS